MIPHAELLSYFNGSRDIFILCFFFLPFNHRDISRHRGGRLFFAVSVTCYISSSPCRPLTWRWIVAVTFKHFNPEGKHKTKSLSRAINGCATVCLLIASLEAQWDSFTVDGADNKGGWLTSDRGHSESLEVVAQLSSATSHYFFSPSVREGPAVKYSSVIPRRGGDENKRRSTRLLTEKKRGGC